MQSSGFIRTQYNRIKCKYLDITVILSLFLVFAVAIAKKVFGVFGVECQIFSVIFYPCLSIFANLLIAKFVQIVFAVKNIKLKKEHYLCILGTFILALIFYTVYLAKIDFIYYWDYSGYLVKQLYAEAAFANGLKEGAKRLLESFSQDYTEFINVFTEFPFCLTNKTGDSYVISQLFNIFIPILFLLSGFIVKVEDYFNIKNKKTFFAVAFAASASFPILHTAFSFGQPDWFGLIFCLSIIILTLDYRFEKLDILLCLTLFLATACLVVTRRWYLYFIFGYYFSYAMLIFINSILNIKMGNKKQGYVQIKNLCVFGAISALLMVAVFFKMIKHILLYSYADRYAYYQLGGFPMECFNQILAVGIFGIIMIIGAVFALKTKKGKGIVSIALLGWFISVFSFTKIQTMGFHHHLMLLPYYYILLVTGIVAIFKVKNKKLMPIGTIFCILAIVIQPFVGASRFSLLFNEKTSIIKKLNPDAFSVVEQSFGNQADKEKVKEIAEWINGNCKDGEKTYLIPHNFRYNPDIFKNVILPDMSLYNKLDFGFDIFGTHSFPVEMFDAKYVITATPFPNKANENGLSNKLNKAFLEISVDKYEKVKCFDMEDGYIFYVYKRIEEADSAEILKYLDVFEEEDRKYPEMFSNVIYQYLEKSDQ